MKIEDDIRRAVKEGAVLQNIEEYVKTEPILSTSREEDRLIAEMADYNSDPDHENKFIPFWDYREFIYWKLADLEEYVSIVGIAWDDKLKSRDFYAVVLPPE